MLTNIRSFRKFANLRILLLILVLQRGTFSLPLANENDIRGNLDELLGEFRREQVFLSNTMLNKSRSLNLPEKLAEAEVEEAEERRAKAYRGKSEAKTPFIATNSRYSLGYIGRGYDLYFGNPLSEDGVVDQGFRLPVIDLPFSFRFTSDGEYRIPDNVDVISEPSASFSSSYYQVKSESDYQSMLKVDASVNAHASGFGLSGSFSASFAYQNSKRNIEKRDTTSLNIIGRAVVYKARLSSTARMSKVSDYFESAVKALPTDRCEEDNMQRLYLQVIEDFGTHYTTQVVMGAKAINEIRFRTSDLDRLSAEGINAKVAAEIAYSGLAVSAGGGFSAGIENKEKQRKRVLNTNKEQREYYIGGSPPSGTISPGQGSTEILREWARSASENPVPIQYKLSSIESLLYPDNFRDLNYGFYERRKCLRKALLTYCMNNIGPNACDERSVITRSKRDTDSRVQKVVRYGDFITLQNRDRSLVLSEQYGTTTGSTIKLLTSAKTSEDFNGLFQIIPLEGQENKMELEVHYGEPFLLRSKEGEVMYMGRKFISNVDEPSEARLMDLFDENMSRIGANKTQSYVEDFAIFHLRNDLRVYLISIQVYVHCYASTKTTHTYQVEMYGKGVTVKTAVTAECMCRYYLCKGYRWYHSIVVEKDIQALESMQIVALQNMEKSIKNVQVKTIMNGIKERFVSRNELRCDTTVCELTFQEPEKASPYCNEVLFPSVDGLTNHHFESDTIMISVDVIVKIQFIEIRSDFEPDIQMAYFDRKFERAVKIKHDMTSESNTDSNIKSFRLTPRYSVYTNAIKLSSNYTNVNLTALKNRLTIVGCPKAKLDQDNGNIQGIEWQIYPTNKEILNYPFLRVASIPDEQKNTDEVYDNFGTPVTTSLSFKVPINGNKINCPYDSNFIHTFLTKTRETSELKYESISIKQSKMIDVEQEGYLAVDLLVTGLTKGELESGIMYLNKTLKSAVDIFPCNNGATSKSRRNGEDPQNSWFKPLMITIAVAVVVLIIILIYVLHRRKRFKTKNVNDRKVKVSKLSKDNQRPQLSIINQDDEAFGKRMNLSEEKLLNVSMGTLFDHRCSRDLYQNESVFASRSDLAAQRLYENE
ncbi:hypothetical protein KUTeg_019205 [Tegillarca granosa]|uniref:MACPF domain-containing protein n=1 Tax=Tegillarca granosa TaxID=220873 RepID=A0ABQ9EBU6_TEGGR|nr:hypothetical protein KUTeg_019205 [Tegillarca granosa]